MKTYIIVNIFKACILLIIYTHLLACQSIPTGQSNDTNHKGYVNSIDGIPIFFSRKGKFSDITLLMIHCWGCNSNYWEVQTEYLSKKYQVVTIDLAGHGKSGSSRDNYRISTYAKDTAAIIEQLKLKNVILVGQELGGAVAIEAGIMRPKLIKGIIAINTISAKQSNNKIIEQILAPFNNNFYKATFPYIKNRFAPYTKKAMVYRLAKDIALAPPEIGLSSLKYYLEWLANKSEQEKSNLTIPLIQIRSSKYQDIINNRENVLYIQSSGFYLPQEEPQKFNTSLEQAINKLISNTPP